jgi:hypothetical protein
MCKPYPMDKTLSERVISSFSLMIQRNLPKFSKMAPPKLGDPSQLTRKKPSFTRSTQDIETDGENPNHPEGVGDVLMKATM